MRVEKEGSQITFICSPRESSLLCRILQSIIAHYKKRPEELDAPAAAAWYSTRGCETARMSAEETREWLWQLLQLKRGHLTFLLEWQTQLLQPQSHLHQLRVPLEQASALITVLNDHRLWAAAQNDIGEKEMTLLSLRALSQLKLAQQRALFEIHFLAYLIEEILHHLSGD